MEEDGRTEEGRHARDVRAREPAHPQGPRGQDVQGPRQEAAEADQGALRPPLRRHPGVVVHARLPGLLQAHPGRRHADDGPGAAASHLARPLHHAARRPCRRRGRDQPAPCAGARRGRAPEGREAGAPAPLLCAPVQRAEELWQTQHEAARARTHEAPQQRRGRRAPRRLEARPRRRARGVPSRLPRPQGALPARGLWRRRGLALRRERPQGDLGRRPLLPEQTGAQGGAGREGLGGPSGLRRPDAGAPGFREGADQGHRGARRCLRGRHPEAPRGPPRRARSAGHALEDDCRGAPREGRVRALRGGPRPVGRPPAHRPHRASRPRWPHGAVEPAGRPQGVQQKGDLAFIVGRS
mmetsp:Transcript_26423/g.87436  ORF Transcript_26423/g.87436 Transcript_26423/m.87436 type:complete len:354 (+) Transcript_26423:568-1629(+)